MFFWWNKLYEFEDCVMQLVELVIQFSEQFFYFFFRIYEGKEQPSGYRPKCSHCSS